MCCMCIYVYLERYPYLSLSIYIYMIFKPMCKQVPLMKTEAECNPASVAQMSGGRHVSNLGFVRVVASMT